MARHASASLPMIQGIGDFDGERRFPAGRGAQDGTHFSALPCKAWIGKKQITKE
jgi:hypothetical protein